MEVSISPTTLLSPTDLNVHLASVPSWREERSEITRTFQFGDFRAALRFVNKVGELAEKAGHHPDIDIRYNKVKLVLSTHDAGGLTEKDFKLAQEIDQIGHV